MAKAKKAVKKAAKKSVRKFSKGEAFKFGWETVKKNFWFFSGTTLLGFAIMDIFSSFGGKTCSLSSVPFMFINFFVVTPFITLGFLKIAIKTLNKQKAKVVDLFSEAANIWKYAVLQFLWLCVLSLVILFVAFLTMLGVRLSESSPLILMILLILFGVLNVWLCVRLMFTINIIVDKKNGPISALKKSWAITKGFAWQLFLFNILSALLLVAGVVLLFVGFLVAWPLVILANMYVYKKLMK